MKGRELEGVLVHVGTRKCSNLLQIEFDRKEKCFRSKQIYIYVKKDSSFFGFHDKKYKKEKKEEQKVFFFI